jgi:flagellar motor switch/type III secretory pathway protein FliN
VEKSAKLVVELLEPGRTGTTDKKLFKIFEKAQADFEVIKSNQSIELKAKEANLSGDYAAAKKLEEASIKAKNAALTKAEADLYEDILREIRVELGKIKTALNRIRELKKTLPPVTAKEIEDLIMSGEFGIENFGVPTVLEVNTEVVATDDYELTDD